MTYLVVGHVNILAVVTNVDFQIVTSSERLLQRFQRGLRGATIEF